MGPLIYLASRSPRRRELLTQLGVTYRLLDIEADETPGPGESPADYVLRVSRAKAKIGRKAVAGAQLLPVLAADTCVVVEGCMLGKPRDREEGLRMLQRLSGKRHHVYTAVALADGGLQSRLSLSRVTFRTLSRRECEAYWESGEPADKAGGYAIQGRAAQFISDLQGSYSGVMGLPLYETAELLRRGGIEWLLA